MGHFSHALLGPGAPRHRSIQSLASYLHVIDAVWSKGVIRLVSQGGTVLRYVVIGLRHINDCLLIKGESVPIQGPISAVDLQNTGKWC